MQSINPFNRPLARFLIPTLILLYVGSDYLLTYIIDHSTTYLKWYWYSLIDMYVFYPTLLLSVIWIGRSTGVSIRQLMGKTISPFPYPTLLGQSIFLYILALASIYITFYPLSFIRPDFVTEWYINGLSNVYVSEEGFPLLPNILNFIGVTTIVPITEELLFRGYLFTRWAHCWSIRKAAVLSSLLFALLHVDMLGSFIFGLAMVAIYVKTRSLLTIIVIHVFFNTIGMCWGYAELYLYGYDYEYTLETFQREWWLGLVSIILMVPWALKYIKSYIPKNHWILPYQ